jgi:hypothetical protein
MMRNRHSGCIGCVVPFFGVIAIYLFVRTVPAGWYMPRHSSIGMYGPVVAGSSIGVRFDHEIYYDDYSPGILYVGNEGPNKCTVSKVGVIARISVNRDLALKFSGVAVPVCPYFASNMMNMDGTIAYRDRSAAGAFHLALIDGSSVRFRDDVIIEDDIPFVMQVGRRLKDSERAVFKSDRTSVSNSWTSHCRIPQTCAYINSYAEGNNSVTLYTAHPAGGFTTNVYLSPLADDSFVTTMGTPEDALFASFEIILGPGRPAARGDRIIYTVWNRRGVVREIEVPPGVYPESEVDLYEAGGRRYIVYSYEKKVRRREVTLGFTFVDLHSGEQIERDVTIPIPPGVGRVN